MDRPLGMPCSGWLKTVNQKLVVLTVFQADFKSRLLPLFYEEFTWILEGIVLSYVSVAAEFENVLFYI